MKQYASMHIEKGTTFSGSLSDHIARMEGREHTYRHADPSRIHLNLDIPVNGDLHKLSLNRAIDKRITEGYQGKTAIRKDAVKYLSITLTGSHEQMTNIFKNEEKAGKWLAANRDWANKEFGAENVVKLTLHRDEKTPHLHLIVVPLTKDGRLTAKEIMGNPEAMSARQGRYAQAMEPFGLERGVKGSKMKHTNEKWYYGQLQKFVSADLGLSVKRYILEVPPPQIEGKPGVFEGFGNWREKQNQAIAADFKGKVVREVRKETEPLKTALNEFQTGIQYSFDQSLKYDREISKLQGLSRELEKKLNPGQSQEKKPGLAR